MNTNNFIIESGDIELAQSICKMITDNEVRNRAVANAIAGSIASKFFDKDNYEVDSESGLHNIGKILENIDISDIYINSNYIDVRVFFNEEEISVPEAHFKNNLLPTAYMFIKINEDLSGANVIGFIAPENIQKDNLINGNYHINENCLQSFYDIEMLLVNQDNDIEISDKDIFAFLDNSLQDKLSFYSSLLQSKEGRLRLARAAKATEIFQFVSVVKEETIEPTVEQESNELSFDNINLEDSQNELMASEDAVELSFEVADENFDLDIETEELNIEESSSDFDLEGATEELNLEENNEELDLQEYSSELSFEESDESFDLNAETEELVVEESISESDFDLQLNFEEANEELVPQEESEELSLEATNSDFDIEEETIELSFEDADEKLVLQEESEKLSFETTDSDLDIEEETIELSFEEAEDSFDNKEISEIGMDNTQETLISEDFEPQVSSDIDVIQLADEEQEIEQNNNLLSFSNDEPEKLEIIEEDSKENLKETTEENQGTSFDFTTVASPSIETNNILEELSNAPEEVAEDNIDNNSETGEQIEALFNKEETSQDEEENSVEDNDDELTQDMELYKSEKSRASIKPVAVIAFLIIAGALGYFGYTKYFAGTQDNTMTANDMPIDTIPSVEESIKAEDAMPVETVEATKTTNNIQNEGISETIPVIEQNLDASILVSNLKVDWEVPAGYASNTSAKRYLVKLGKIIQLNLKTELLLLNKPPITNKISVEIKYNNGTRKFETAGIVVSSGEKSVDDLILHTVNKVLGMNLSVNTDSLSKLQGNPVLIIHL